MVSPLAVICSVAGLKIVGRAVTRGFTEGWGGGSVVLWPFFSKMAVFPAVSCVPVRVFSADFSRVGFEFGFAPFFSRNFVSASGGFDGSPGRCSVGRNAGLS